MVSPSHNSMLFFLFFTANLWLCFVPSTAELKRFEHPVKADGSLSFLVVGDWGRKGLYNQSLVATQSYNLEDPPKMANPSVVPSAYLQGLDPAVPEWLNKGDNAWQKVSAALSGMQGMPGLVILYAGLVKKKWALNSAFMALFAFAAVMPCWVLWAYKMSFGEKLLPFWGKAGLALSQDYLILQTVLPSTQYKDITPAATPLCPTATMVFFQYAFAAVTVILLAGSVLGRMSIRAWMAFVPLWITFSYTVGAFSVWGGGFLFQWGVMDYSGGYVVHLASGAAGFTAAYWVGPRSREDRKEFPPNNLSLALAGAGIIWMGWTGFNGGDPFSANVGSSMAVLKTHICAATSLLVWTCWDVLFFKKPSVIGAIQGMISGLVCITPGAGLVQGWAALVMGIASGTIPWYTMMVLSKKLPFLQKVDDTLGVFHTHAVAGTLGGALTGVFAHPYLSSMFLPVPNSEGSFYGGRGGVQLWKQLVAAAFIIGWNVVATSIILNVIRLIIPLQMTDEEIKIGDDAAHLEEAYAFQMTDEEIENRVDATHLEEGYTQMTNEENEIVDDGAHQGQGRRENFIQYCMGKVLKISFGSR